MTDFVPSEKGVTIRQPSTANLMLDSADRNENIFPSANSFTITRPQSILNGFFTRIGTTEVVLEWNVPNVSVDLSNDVVTIDLSGSVSGTNTVTVNVPTGFYTQAALLNWLVSALNTASSGLGPVPTWSISATTVPGQFALTTNALVDVTLTGTLVPFLFGVPTFGPYLIGPGGGPALAGILLVPADLRPVRYLDFVSANLTYNQDLKDSTTAVTARDVLCRWYFAFDNPPALDAYNFPILMGYTPFVLRRTFSPPKQIKWAANQPIGQLAFQVYDDTNKLAPFNTPGPQFQTNWLMTLQVSEV